MSNIIKLRANTIATMERLGYTVGQAVAERRNPYTGIRHVLEPEAVRLYDFITAKRWTCGADYTREEWDNARYHFMSRWPNQYFDLLD